MRGAGIGPEHNGAARGLLAAALAALSCAGDAPPRAPLLPPPDAAAQAVLARALDEAAAATPRAAGALVVRLAFAAADLDLYVTDPQQETVYFANTPTRSGGRLAADLGCADPEPRVETVVFAAPLAGRYRIGVDHPQSCRAEPEPETFVVEVASEGGVRRAAGTALFRRFDSRVLELELP